MPRPPRPPDPNALFDDDSGEGEAASGGSAGARRAAEPAPASLPFEARLVVEKGDYAGKVVKLGGGTAMIGRSSKCELSLKGSSGVSRRHCKVQLIGDRYVVIDLESRNGTVVNGETVSRKFLADGDLLEIGDEHVRFIATQKAGAAKGPARGNVPEDVDIEDLPTALVPGMPPLPAPPKTKPDPREASSAQRTSSKRAERGASAKVPVGARPPPLPPGRPPAEAQRAPPPVPQAPEDRTATFALDPGVLNPVTRDDQAPPALPDDDDDDLAPPPARAPRDAPARRAPVDALPPPLADEPPRRRGFPVLGALLVVALLVVAGLAVAAWDLAVGERRILALLRERAPALADALDDVPARGPGDTLLADGGAADGERAAADAGAAAAAGVGLDAGPSGADAGSAVADAPDAGSAVADAPDAGDAVADAPDAGVDGAADGAADGAVVRVGASASGRVASVRVQAGSVVKKGQTLAVLEASGGLKKKLDALREEERAFEQAVKKGNKAARRDLEAVRADIAELSRRVRGAPLTSDAAGTVVEVLVREGASVRSGQPVVTLAP